ncbi:MAG: fimbrial protein [Proteiniphilum sp.]|nr:fimbrial protein [Proteiniphilum sp.]MDD3908819.1 fimbrial protein [Proteiniphilum sp.]
MKLGKLVLAGVVALGLGLTACNNDDVPNAIKEGEKATVSIKITQAAKVSPTVKAIGTETASELTVAESNIKKLDVFVFNGDAVDGHGTASGTNVLEVKDIAVTTGSRTLVVVANATADMGSITSKAALLAKVATDLSAQTLTNGLLMTSEETAPFTIAAGKNYYGYTAGQTPAGTEHSVGIPVKLTRVPARVALVSATTAFTESYTGFTFEPEQVFLFNAKKQSKYFGANLVAGTELLSGVDLTSFTGPLRPATWDAGWTVTYLQDAITDLTTISTDKPVYYYTFENDATVRPTVLSVKGKIKKADGTPATATEFPGAIADDQGTTYYSIVVNANKGGYSYTGDDVAHDGKIIRNTQYNLSITIKHLGKDDPTDPPTEAAMLDVLVEVVPWAVVNQNVEY